MNVDVLKVQHNKTGQICEMTHNDFFGFVIWLVDYKKIPKGSIATKPYVMYDDDPDFKNWMVL